jgi:hypothetical protein
MRCAAGSRSAERKFLRVAENTDNIRGFGASDICSTAAKRVRGRGARDQKNRRDDALSMPSGLCKKPSSERLANEVASSISARIERIAAK